MQQSSRSERPPVRRRRAAALALLAAVGLSAAATGDEPARPAAGAEAAAAPAAGERSIDPRTDDLLHAAGQYLADAKSFSFTAEVWEDVVSSSGRKLQSQRNVEVGVRRPDHVVAHTRSQFKSRDAYYDGKTLTIYEHKTNNYGVITDVPKTIDETVDFVSARFGIAVPLGDLIVSHVRDDILKSVRSGDYLGMQKVAGVPCHHLAFVQDNIDWQLWIEEGTRPLVRRLLITYKNEDESPQYSATISDWNMNAELPEYAFKFRAPVGATKIDVLPAKSDDAGQQGDADVAGKKLTPDASKTSDPAKDRKE
jgi:hypothetical protein